MLDSILSVLDKISVSLGSDTTIANQSEILAKLRHARKRISRAAQIQHSHNTLFTNPVFDLTPILRLITAFQNNIDQNDYLTRSKSTKPLADYPIKETAIPAIFNAVTLLVNIVIEHKKRDLKKLVGTSDIATLRADTLLARFDSTRIHKKSIDTPITTTTIRQLLNKLRIHLITNCENLPDDVMSWADSYHYSYVHYPKKQFELYKKQLDHIEIDRILQKKHYSNTPLEKVVADVHLGGSQPSCVALRTDETAQYDTKTGRCFDLNSPYKLSGEYKEVSLSENYPARLISIGISNCHNVLIKDVQGHIWMLHVSPNSIQAHNLFSGMPAKPAYDELNFDYMNEHIQLRGNLEVVVIEKNRTFFREVVFRNTLPWYTTIASFKRIEVDQYVDLNYTYSVCYATDTNELVISGAKKTNGDVKTTSLTILHIFKPSPDITATDQLMEIDNDKQINDRVLSFLTSLKTNIESSETIRDKSTLLNIITEVITQLATSNLNYQHKYELLLKLLRALQENINQYDYLNRNNAVIPLVDQPIKAEYIPYIYKAVTILIDLLIAIQKKSITQVNSSDAVNNALRRLRTTLITNHKSHPDEIDSWLHSQQYTKYPREFFSKHQRSIDLIEIDLILQKRHYSNISIEDAVRCHQNGEFNDPSIIYVSENKILQYNPATNQCYKLNSYHKADGSYKQVEHHANYPLNFVAFHILNGHTIIIKDESNRVWMLHVSKSAVTRVRNSYIEISCGPPRLAYSDLSIEYKHDDIKLSGKLDIIVIDNPNGCFNRGLLESQLPKNTAIASLKVIEADFYLKETKEYSACYSLEDDKLTIVGYQRINWEVTEKVMTVDNVFHSLRLNHSVQASLS